jgi:hypothetical protein
LPSINYDASFLTLFSFSAREFDSEFLCEKSLPTDDIYGCNLTTENRDSYPFAEWGRGEQ